MAQTVYSFEGQPDGTAASQASIGASALTVGAGNTVRHSAAAAISGTVGLEFLGGVTAVSVADFTSFTIDDDEWFRIPVELPSGGFAVDNVVAQFYGSSTGTAVIARLRVKTDGSVVFANAAESQILTLNADMSAYYGTKVVFEVHLQTGTTNANGQVHAKVFPTPATTINNQLGSEAVATNFNLGSAGGITYPITRFRIGLTVVQGTSKSVKYDQVVVENDRATYIGPAANVAPVATMMARPAPQPAGQVTGTATITDDASVKSATVTIVSGPQGAGVPSVTVGTSGLNSPSTTVNWSFNAVPGRYVVRAAGTDNNDTPSNNSDVIVDVYAASSADVKPYARLVGTNTVTGAGGDAVAAMIDNNSATLITSPAPPAHSKERWQYCAFPPGPLRFRCRNYQTPSTPAVSVQATVFKEDGTTQLYQTTFSPPTAEADTFITLDNTAMTALGAVLSDRRALIIEFDPS